MDELLFIEYKHAVVIVVAVAAAVAADFGLKKRNQ